MSDFRDNFGAPDTSDFGNIGKEAEAIVKKMFQTYIDSAKKADAQTLSSRDAIRVKSEMEKMYTSMLAKGTSTLEDTISEYSKFVKELKNSEQPLENMEASLKAVKTVLNTQLEPQLKSIQQEVEKSSKAFKETLSKAIQDTGQTMEDTANQMYSSAGNVVSYYRFWLADMPKKFGGAFKKVGEVFNAFSEKSKANSKNKEIIKQYEKLQKEMQVNSSKGVNGVIRVMSLFARSLGRDSESIKRSMDRTSKAMREASKSSAASGGQGGGGGVSGGIGKTMGAIGSVGGAIGGFIGAFGNVIANNLEYMMAKAQMDLDSKMAAYQGMASQGIYSNYGFEKGGARIGGQSGFTLERFGEAAGTGFTQFSNVIAGQIAGAEKSFNEHLNMFLVANRTIWEGMNVGSFLEGITRRNAKAGEDFHNATAALGVKMFGKDGLGGYVGVLTGLAKDIGINPRVAAASLNEFHEEMMKTNASIESSVTILAGLTKADESFKKLGMSVEKSLGKISKSFVSMIKGWSKGLTAFMGMKVFGTKSPFEAYYKMQTGGGRGDTVVKTLGAVFDQVNDVTKNLKGGGAGEKFMGTELMMQDLFGADPEMAKLVSEKNEMGGQAGMQSLLGDKDIVKQMQQAMQASQMSQEKAIQGTWLSSERQRDNQVRMMQIQERMLTITNLGFGLLVGFTIKSFTFLAKIYMVLANIGMAISNFLPSWASPAGMKEIMGSGLTAGKGAIEKLDKVGDGLMNMDNLNKMMGLLGKTVVDVVGGGTAKEMISTLGSNKKSIEPGHLDALEKLPSQFKEVFDGFMTTFKAEFLKAKLGSKHFGGGLEKFHFGGNMGSSGMRAGVIKRGTEAILMSPNPTSVLSPADTRQATRGGGSSGTPINVHFNGPVYGVPNLESLVKGMVIKAASGIR